MRLSRRGLILGGAAFVASCSSVGEKSLVSGITPADLPPVTAPLESPVIVATPKTTLDPGGLIRKPLLDQAVAALDRHGARVPMRDAMYVVDFQRHSAQPRLYRVDLESGATTAFHTAHGRGSDPEHSGFARMFSNTPNSLASSVGSYVTAGMSSGTTYAENVLLDGLEGTNYMARDRAIIVHAADYCEPAYIAQHGKPGRSNGCFSLSSADLAVLRPAMDRGRLLFVGA